jgi:glycosyltransferase involved in cell wall biosynthesis
MDDPPPIDIVGDGPLAGAVRAAAESQPSITWHGQLPAERVMALMHRAFMMVLPSVCYESFPMVLVEAFAAGLPVVASDRGAMSVLIEEGVTGLLFPAGEAAQLAERISWAYAHPGEVRVMGKNGRRLYRRSYTGDRNYLQLLEIYEQALARRRQGLEVVENGGMRG